MSALTDEQWAAVQRLFSKYSGMRPDDQRRHLDDILGGAPSAVTAAEVTCPECGAFARRPCVEMMWDGQVPVLAPTFRPSGIPLPSGQVHAQREQHARMVREDWLPGQRLRADIDADLVELPPHPAA